MKIRANDFDFRDSECLKSFSKVVFNCKVRYCFFDEELNNTRLTLKTLIKFIWLQRNENEANCDEV